MTQSSSRSTDKSFFLTTVDSLIENIKKNIRSTNNGWDEMWHLHDAGIVSDFANDCQIIRKVRDPIERYLLHSRSHVPYDQVTNGVAGVDSIRNHHHLHVDNTSVNRVVKPAEGENIVVDVWEVNRSVRQSDGRIFQFIQSHDRVPQGRRLFLLWIGRVTASHRQPWFAGCGKTFKGKVTWCESSTECRTSSPLEYQSIWKSSRALACGTGP